MDAAHLEQHLKKPGIHQAILRDYQGAYALGIQPGEDGDARFVLHVEGDDPDRFVTSVEIDDETILVEIKCGFRRPTPLAG